MKSKDISFYIFYAPIFIAFAIGIFLSHEIPDLFNDVWLFFLVGVILIIIACFKLSKAK